MQDTRNENLKVIRFDDTAKKMKRSILSECDSLKEFGNYFKISVDRKRLNKDSKSANAETKELALRFKAEICLMEKRSSKEGSDEDDGSGDEKVDNEEDDDSDSDDENRNGMKLCLFS